MAVFWIRIAICAAVGYLGVRRNGIITVTRTSREMGLDCQAPGTSGSTFMGRRLHLKWLAGSLAAGLVAIALGVCLRPSKTFSPQSSSAMVYERVAALAEKSGCQAVVSWSLQKAQAAREAHLRRGVKSGRIALIRFEDVDRVGFDGFGRAVFRSLSNQPTGFLMVRPWPTPQNPKSYDVFMQPDAKDRVTALIAAIKKGNLEMTKTAPSPFE